jgi:hypothetical protein
VKRILTFVAAIFSGCSNVFYLPSPVMVRTPGDIGLQFEPVSISDEGEPTLKGWFLPSSVPVQGTVLFLHGNAENISTHFANIYWLPRQGYQTYIFDYAGYGESEGSVSVDGIHRDIARMIRSVLHDTRVDPSRMYLMGQSLGASMALYTAGTPEFNGAFRAVVADSPFSSYRSIAREKLSLFWITYPLQWPLGFLVDDTYSPDRVVNQISVPVLLIHGGDDHTVPPEHSRKLCALLAQRCVRFEIPGVDHGGTLQRPDVRAKIVDFLKNPETMVATSPSTSR